MEFSSLQSQEKSEKIAKEQKLTYLRQERLSKPLSDNTKIKSIIAPEMFKIYQKHKEEESEYSMITSDDIATYLRFTLHENKLRRPMNRMIASINNFHVSQGKEIWVNSRNLMNQIASEIVEKSEY